MTESAIARPAPGSMNSSTVVVIVNYRTPRMVLNLLESIRDTGAPPLGIVVVDNASGDDSLAVLQEAPRAVGNASIVRVEALARNVGFAGGNNAGIAVGRREWPAAAQFFLVNPDTVLRPGAISALEGHLETHPRAGIVGAQLEAPDSSLECSAHGGDGVAWQFVSTARLRTAERLVRSGYRRVIGHSHPVRCDWVSGAALMVRDRVLRDVGPLDSRFFLYFEEVDFCRRARRARWEVWSEPASRVVHFEGSSTGITAGRRPRYWFDSRRRYFLKRGGVLGLLAADTAWACGRLLRWCADRISAPVALGGPPHFARDLLLGDVIAVASGDVSGL